MPHVTPLPLGLILEKRYKVIAMLGQGGFGRVYLAENLNRFNERCVLKEFAPQVKGSAALQKAVELFQREAGVLYQLQHPQIPEFRELLQTQIDGEDCVFLVQQYIEGPTYAELVEQGKRFTEVEVLGLLLDLLPVLDYIHRQGVIHRDIAPDNLIQQRLTGKPVLIDFGGVKQIAASAVRQLTHQPVPTQLAKQGYTPPEQKHGKAYPASDLYALAITAIVLLTGKSPLALYDSDRHAWCWQQEAKLHPTFAGILDRLLADAVSDRYQSAQEVQQALQAFAQKPNQASSSKTKAIARLGRSAVPTPPAGSTSEVKTLVVAPIYRPQPTPTPVATPAKQAPPPPPPPATVAYPNQQAVPLPIAPQPTPAPFSAPIRFLGRMVSMLVLQPIHTLVVKPLWYILKRLLVLAIASLIILGVGAWLKPQLLAWVKQLQVPQVIQSSQSCQERLIQRHEALGVQTSEVYPQVNAKLYANHPELEGRALTNSPKDAPLRQEWCAIAHEVLDQLERSQRQR